MTEDEEVQHLTSSLNRQCRRLGEFDPFKEDLSSRSHANGSMSDLSEESGIEDSSGFLPVKRPAADYADKGKRGPGRCSALSPIDRPATNDKKQNDGEDKSGEEEVAHVGKYSCAEFSDFGMNTPYIWVAAV